MIKSKYHFWIGEMHPEGHSWRHTDENGTKEFENVKFYGFFDNNLIQPEDYKPVTHNDVAQLLHKEFYKDLEEENYQIAKIDFDNILAELKKIDFNYVEIFHLDLNEEKDFAKVHPFSVYSFFVAFALIDRPKKTIITIEWGMD